jgi:hypothetical protein
VFGVPGSDWVKAWLSSSLLPLQASVAVPDQVVLFFIGTLLLLGWAAIIVTSIFRSVRIFPRMSSTMILVLALLIALSGFFAIPYLYATILALTMITSGFAGGLGIGLIRLRGILPEKIHVALAILAVVLEVLGFLGLSELDFVLRIMTLVGLMLLVSSESVRSVLVDLVGGLSRLMILFMLGASILLLPMLIPSFALLVDAATVGGLVLGLSLNYVFFPRIR